MLLAACEHMPTVPVARLYTVLYWPEGHTTPVVFLQHSARDSRCRITCIVYCIYNVTTISCTCVLAMQAFLSECPLQEKVAMI
jgi:hypothetical protein